MKSKITIITATVAGAVMIAFCRTANPLFEFCTTKSYGWPFPWKVDYCPCKGAVVAYHPGYWLSNFAILISVSLLAGFCFRTPRKQFGPSGA